MQVPALIALDSFYLYSPQIIGDFAAMLGKITDPKIKTAPVICITKETLLEIAQLNQLNKLLEQYWRYQSNSHTVAELKRVFFNQVFPEEIRDGLLEWYESEIKTEFVRVIASHHQQLGQLTQNEHVVGENNMLESILDVWWQSLQPLLKEKSSLQSALQLAPTAICLQKESRAEASGIAYSLHPQTGIKNVVYIEAVRGHYLSHLSVVAETHEFELASGEITSFEGDQTEIWVTAPDEIMPQSLSPHQQAQKVLANNEVKQIAELTTKIKKKFIHQVQVIWVKTKSDFEVLRVEPYYISDQASFKRTNFKLMVTASNPQLANNYKEMDIDGIGLFKSDYIFLAEGIHPLQLLKTTQKTTLKQDLMSAIITFRKAIKNKQFVYQPLSADTHTLRSLKYAEHFEPVEENPLLGIKGALKAASMPEIFTFELEVLKEVQQFYPLPLAVTLPFSRSQKEQQHMIKLAKASGLLEMNKTEVWMPIMTPEQLLNLNEYIHPTIKSFMLDLPTLHSLFIGFDPDYQDVAVHYPLTESFLAMIIELAQPIIQNPDINVYLHLDNPSKPFLELGLANNLTGVIVKPSSVILAKKTIINWERYGKN